MGVINQLSYPGGPTLYDIHVLYMLPPTGLFFFIAPQLQLTKLIEDSGNSTLKPLDVAGIPHENQAKDYTSDAMTWFPHSSPEDVSHCLNMALFVWKNGILYPVPSLSLSFLYFRLFVDEPKSLLICCSTYPVRYKHDIPVDPQCWCFMLGKKLGDGVKSELSVDSCHQFPKL